MDLSALERILWAAGFAASVALLCVLVYRRRWKKIPVFCTLIAFIVTRTIALYLAYRFGSPHLYAVIYWPAECLDFLLQLGVVAEIARIVLRPTGTWVSDAKRQFLLWGGAGVVVALLLAWMMSPPAANALDRLEMRGNLFTSLVICELFTVVSMTSNELGLGWRSHAIALGHGLTAWSCLSVLIDVLHSYYGRMYVFTALEHVRVLVFFGTVSYWVVQFWRDEPARQPISPELQARILALHRRVQYDLGRIANGID